MTRLAVSAPGKAFLIGEYAVLAGATALVTSWHSGEDAEADASRQQVKMLIEPQNVPELLGHVASLISRRASRRIARRLRQHA